MWKEILTDKDFEMIANLKDNFGCMTTATLEVMKNYVVRKKDCHYYYYKDDIMELTLGYRQLEDYINFVAYVIKADIEDYDKAIDIMADHNKAYLISKGLKKIVVHFGSSSFSLMTTANVGVGKLGYKKYLEEATKVVESKGFKATLTDKDFTIELV